MMKVGFTGTQNDLTLMQFDLLVSVLQEIEEILEAHHGDCIGADATFSETVDLLYPDAIIHIHPPTNNSKRAYCGYDEISDPYPYLTRNRHIVKASDILIACPKTLEEEMRSGTWATVRYARKVGKPIVILWNNGKYTYENKSTVESGTFEEDAVETTPLQEFLRSRRSNVDTL